MVTPANDTPAYRPDPRLAEHIQKRMRYAQNVRREYENQWDINKKLYEGAHAEVFNEGKATRETYVEANRIQNAVIIQTATQTETPPRPSYQPRESNEPPIFFFKRDIRADADRAGQLTDLGLSEGQLAGTEPIPADLAEQILSITTQVEVDLPPEARQPPAEGQPQETTQLVDVPVFDEQRDFYVIVDQTTSDAYTQEVLSEWEVADGDVIIRDNILETNIIGHGDTLIGWDAEKLNITLTPLHPLDCWIDPDACSVATAEYYIVSQVKPLSEAQRDYPEIAEQLAEKVTSGRKNGFFSSLTSLTSRAFGGEPESERDTVEVVTIWERNHPVRMTPEEAVEAGEARPLTETVSAGFTPEGEQQFAEEPVADPETGQPLFELPDGSSVTADSPDFPTKYVVRQLTMVEEFVIDDGESPINDIPIARNRNIPIIHSPYAQGEPERLMSLTKLHNRLLSIFNDHATYFRSPQQVMPKSVQVALESALRGLHATGKNKIGVPDNIWNRFAGQIVQAIPTPEIGQTFFNVITMIQREMDQIAGTVDVLRGEAKSEWSGTTVGLLQDAARGPIGYKARHTADYMRRIGRLSLEWMRRFLPPEVAAQRNAKYPQQVFSAMRDRIKRVDFDVVAEVSGATPKRQQAETQMNALQNIPALQTSPTFIGSTIDKMGVAEVEKVVGEIQAAAQAPPAA